MVKYREALDDSCENGFQAWNTKTGNNDKVSGDCKTSVRFVPEMTSKHEESAEVAHVERSQYSI